MNHNQAIQEIDEVIALLPVYWNRHDLQAYCGLWKEDADFVNVLGMHRAGRGELLRELEYLHAGRFRDTEISLERRQVRLLTPDVAVVHMWWVMRGDPGMPEIGVRGGERHGVFTHVLERTPEGWRFVASQNTDVLPVPDPLQAPQAALSAR